MFKAFLLLAAFCFNPDIVSAQVDWKPATNEKGIKVFVKNVPESRIKALKLECELDAGLAQVVALLLDVSSSGKWIPHTKSCVMIPQISPRELIYYTEVSLPWPLYNRDFVSHMRIFQDPLTKVVTVDAPTIAGEVTPKKGIVRVNQSSGRWVLTPLKKDRVKLDYTLVADPGGIIPAPLVNYFASQEAIESVKNMKKLLQLAKYRNADIPFILN